MERAFQMLHWTAVVAGAGMLMLVHLSVRPRAAVDAGRQGGRIVAALIASLVVATALALGEALVSHSFGDAVALGLAASVIPATYVFGVNAARPKMATLQALAAMGMVTACSALIFALSAR